MFVWCAIGKGYGRSSTTSSRLNLLRERRESDHGSRITSLLNTFSRTRNHVTEHEPDRNWVVRGTRTQLCSRNWAKVLHGPPSGSRTWALLAAPPEEACGPASGFKRASLVGPYHEGPYRKELVFRPGPAFQDWKTQDDGIHQI